MTEFITIGTTDELQPGDAPLVVEINRRWVAVYNLDGQYYAIEDVCTHDGGPLAEGEREGHVVACPRHGATFDIRTGKVLSAPALVDVPTYAVRVEANQIQVGERRKP
ncbi:MAG: non-heme iron oxygenase ferredoxin subunit [Anaerolineae bacterium]